MSTTGTAGQGIRTARELAMARWGTPIPEPDPVPDDEDATRVPAFGHLRVFTHVSPSMRAAWADLLRGGQALAGEHPVLVIPYWVFGLAALPVAAGFKIGYDSCIRPGRFAAFLATVLLFTAGLWLAGVI